MTADTDTMDAGLRVWAVSRGPRLNSLWADVDMRMRSCQWVNAMEDIAMK